MDIEFKKREYHKSRHTNVGFFISCSDQSAEMDLKKDIFKASITCPKEQVFFVLEDDVLGL